MTAPAVFPRLTRVELRKMTDTRSGFWLLAATAAVIAGAVAIATAALPGGDRSLLNLFQIALAPVNLLLPVVGILLVTAEWSQRTGMQTFALVPRRHRVLVAKLAAGVALAAIAYGLCLALAGLATAARGTDWSLPAGIALQQLILVGIAMLSGMAYGAALLSPAPAIVASFALPAAASAIGSLSAVRGVARWLDLNRTTDPMGDHLLHGAEWARFGTSLLLWLAVPIAVGCWRVLRADVR